MAGSLLVFIPLTGEYLIPAILGGNKTSYTGSLIAQQFTEVHDWPFGSAIAVVVIAAMTVVLLVFSRCANRGRPPVARSLLGAHAVLVFVFLYAPIVVVVAYAFNGGRETLVWDGFSTKWFGQALHDTAVTEALQELARDRRGQRGRRLQSSARCSRSPCRGCGSPCAYRSRRS